MCILAFGPTANGSIQITYTLLSCLHICTWHAVYTWYQVFVFHGVPACTVVDTSSVMFTLHAMYPYMSFRRTTKPQKSLPTNTQRTEPVLHPKSLSSPWNYRRRRRRGRINDQDQTSPMPPGIPLFHDTKNRHPLTRPNSSTLCRNISPSLLNHSKKGLFDVISAHRMMRHGGVEENGTYRRRNL